MEGGTRVVTVHVDLVLLVIVACWTISVALVIGFLLGAADAELENDPWDAWLAELDRERAAL